MSADVNPLPGDFACVSMGGIGGRLVGLGERLCGDAFTQYQHAFIYIGDRRIVQAEPGGAAAAMLGSYGSILWSTGKIPLTAAQRDDIVNGAVKYEGTPYSWLDYLAIAAHRLHVPVPGLKSYIGSTGHQICSQLVDQCYADAGVHLFAKRWPGYVTPADLAGLVSGEQILKRNRYGLGA